MGAAPPRLPGKLKGLLDSLDWADVAQDLARLPAPSADAAPGFDERVRVAPFRKRDTAGTGGEADVTVTLDMSGGKRRLRVEILVEIDEPARP